jgi:ABC-type uncharacterized transport system permease subunit
MALAIIRGRLPAPLRSAVMTFSGVASNFAGVPLAFAFIATLGRLGLVTIILRTVFGFDLYRSGFNLLSFWGLTLTYLYFQIPLMMLTIAPPSMASRRSGTRRPKCWAPASGSSGAMSACPSSGPASSVR